MGTRAASLCLACIVAACRAHDPLSLEPARETLVPTYSPEAEPKPGSAMESLAAPLAPHRTHLEIPFANDAVFVAPVSATPPVVLFPEERVAIRRRVARWLAESGYDVVPMEELERIEAAAAERRLVLEEDAVCRVPLSPDDVHARYFPALRTAFVGAHCLGDCWLGVSVQQPGSPDATASYAAGVARSWDPGAWTSAVARLEQTRARVWGVTGGLAPTSSPPPITVSVLRHIGPWDQPPDFAIVSALQGKTNGCGHPDPNIGMTWTLGLEIDRAGRVQRCAAESEHSRARDSEADCLCRAASRLQFQRGKAERRVQIEAIDSGRHASAVVRTVQHDTESWVNRLQESGATAKCEPELTRTEPLEVTAVLSLTPDGSVNQVELFGAIDDAPTMRWAACLVHEWSSLELPCAPPGIEQLQATVDFPGR